MYICTFGTSVLLTNAGDDLRYPFRVLYLKFVGQLNLTPCENFFNYAFYILFRIYIYMNEMQCTGQYTFTEFGFQKFQVMTLCADVMNAQGGGI